MPRCLFNRPQFLFLALLLAPVTLDATLCRPSVAGGNHGGGGEEALEAGEFVHPLFSASKAMGVS